MFYDRFIKDNWKVVYFRALIVEYSKHKGKTNLESLVDKKVIRRVAKEENSNQIELFDEDVEKS